MISKDFIEALAKLVDAYGEYLEKEKQYDKQLNIHQELNNILEKLADNLKQNCIYKTKE